MPTSVNEVESVMKELQDKQVQIVSLQRSLKKTKDVLSKPVCVLVNLVFGSGTFFSVT